MKKAVLIPILYLISITASSQGVESLALAAGDAGHLGKNYVNPFVKGFMYDLNSGWYTTAKTHKKFGFDITINPSISFVPTSDEFFTFNPNDYQYLTLPNGETRVPTVMSTSEHETLVRVEIPHQDGNIKVAEFNMPKGIASDLPLNAVPVPMAQIGMGLFANTDVKVRLVPNITIEEDFSFSLFGLGLQHDLTQYFNIEKSPLNISVLGAFTNMKTAYRIENDPAYQNVEVKNGEAEFKVNAWTIQGIASLDFKLITFYGAVGYNNGKTTAKMKGEYILTYDLIDVGGIAIGEVSETIYNPVNQSFQANGVRGTLGTRLNLGFFKIFADYTLQEYNTLTAGIALSFN